jgi:hypothetical protein
LTHWIKEIALPELSDYFPLTFPNNLLQPVLEDKRNHPYVLVKNKDNDFSVGFLKKRIHTQKNGYKIECLNIEICDILLYSDNNQKAIIKK